MKSEQDYMNDIQVQKEKIQELIKEKERLYNEIAATHEKKEQAVQELKAEIQRIEKPFLDSVKQMEQQHKKAEDDGYEAEREIRLIEADIKFIPARDSEGYPTAESFAAFLVKNGVHGVYSRRSTITMIQKKLPNGVALFRHGDGSDNPSFSAYYAVKGKDIVGFHFTEKARHPGDEATPDGWVGKKLMRAKNVLKVQRTEKYGNGTSTYECIAAFKEWKEVMSNQTTFTALDMSDKVNRELLGEDYRISFNDELDKIFYEK